MITNREQIIAILDYVKSNCGGVGNDFYNDEVGENFKTTIYIDIENGSDLNDGYSENRPLRTMKKVWEKIPLFYFNSYEIISLGDLKGSSDDIFKPRFCLGKKFSTESNIALKCGITLKGIKDNFSSINLINDNYVSINNLNDFELADINVSMSSGVYFNDCKNISISGVTFSYDDNINKIIFNGCDKVYLKRVKFNSIQSTGMSNIYMNICTPTSDGVKVLSEECSKVVCEDSSIGSQYVETTGGKIEVINN